MCKPPTEFVRPAGRRRARESERPQRWHRTSNRGALSALTNHGETEAVHGAFPSTYQPSIGHDLFDTGGDVQRGMSIFPGPMVQDEFFPPLPPYPMYECG